VVGVQAVTRRRFLPGDSERAEAIRRFFAQTPGLGDETVSELGSGIVLDTEGHFLPMSMYGHEICLIFRTAGTRPARWEPIATTISP
jgi:hypothetical protein